MPKTRRNRKQRKTRKGGTYDTSPIRDGYAIEEQQNGKDRLLFFWTPKNKICILTSLDSPTEAILQQVNYFKECTQDGMKRGQGTVNMVNYLFSMLRKRGIKRVTLTDKSTFPCTTKDNKSINVSLPLYSFVNYAKTWYERHFGFKLLNEDDARAYDEARNLLFEDNNPNITLEEMRELTEQPCEYFETRIVDPKTNKQKTVAEDLIERLGIKMINNVWYKDL